MTRKSVIFNLTRGEAVCLGELADKPLARMRGLMWRRAMGAGEGLLLSPAPAIHTAFMRFSIDALFLDRDLRVLQIVERLRPWRMAAQPGARAVLELPAGESARRGVRVGDVLALRGTEQPALAEVEAPLPATAGTASVIEMAGAEELAALRADRAGSAGVLEAGRTMEVAVISTDPRFRAAISVLLARRECGVATASSMHRLGDLLAGERVDVAVIDISEGQQESWAASIAALPASLGVVLVADGGRSGSGHPRALAKWGPFAELHLAIERASRRRVEVEA